MPVNKNVTTENWDDPSFWANISLVDEPGNRLRFVDLPSNFTIRIDNPDQSGTEQDPNRIVINNGFKTFQVYNSGDTRGDAQLGTGGISLFDEVVLNDTSGANVVQYDGGPQTILGGDGVDRVFTNDGNDTIRTGDGDDFINAGDGGDSINGGLGDDSISAGSGNDSVLGAAGNDTIDAGAGNDTVSGGTEDDRIDGGAGNDSLSGDGQNDTIEGNIGADTLDGGNGADSLDGGDGNDSVVGGADNDTLRGGAGFDDLSGDGGDDRILGGDGADTIEGGAGSDTIIGGSNDSASADTGDLIYGDENTIDALAVAGSDSIEGGKGNDTIYGFGGADTIKGGIGDDFLYGGTSAYDGSVINGPSDDATGNDLISGGAGNDEIFGGAGSDTLIGGDGSDSIRGGSENDSVDGGAGQDFIQGGFGDDSLDGAAGNDTIFGDENSYTFGVAVGDDSIRGGTGDDLLVAQAGNDTVRGGDGNDTIAGGGTIFDGTDLQQTAGDGDTDDRPSDDSLFGDSGDDIINGGAGNDTMDGGLDNDILRGSSGNDVFIEQDIVGGDGADTIVDFNVGNTGPITDGDQTNNDFVDLNSFFNQGEGGSDNTLAAVNSAGGDFSTALGMLRADAEDGRVDGIIGGVDYSAQIGDVDLTIQNGGAAVTGESLTFDNTNVVCFAAGTLIMTIEGLREVEALQVGDLVLTMDNGYQPLRWLGYRHLDAAALQMSERLRPIRIKAHALGANSPETDLVVSPQHRILLRSKVALRMFGEYEILVSARSLTELDGIDVAWDEEPVTYFHLMFDQHEIVYANGTPAESLYLGKMAIATLSPEAKCEILEIFPNLEDENFQQAMARHSPEKGKHIRKLLVRLQANSKVPLESVDRIRLG